MATFPDRSRAQSSGFSRPEPTLNPAKLQRGKLFSASRHGLNLVPCVTSDKKSSLTMRARFHGSATAGSTPNSSIISREPARVSEDIEGCIFPWHFIFACE